MPPRTQPMKPIYVVAGLCLLTLLLVYRSLRSFEPPSSESCPWIFQKYQMSDYESTWVTNSANPEWMRAPCRRIYKEEKQVQEWLAYSSKSQEQRPLQPPNPDIYSKYTYKRMCDGEARTIWIEPLALNLRNPLYCKEFLEKKASPGSGLVEKQYMHVDWEMFEQSNDGTGKVYMFDMGASLFNTGFGGASQSWFVSQIEMRGLKLDGIWAWEYTQHNANDVFADIPERLWPIYHWYNIPVSYNLSTMSNPWNVLMQTAKPNDLVIVKLDIDSPTIEQNLILQLIANEKIASLVDVLFYEDHFDIESMHPIFGENGRYMNVVIDIFKRMRDLGIRAHAWV